MASHVLVSMASGNGLPPILRQDYSAQAITLTDTDLFIGSSGAKFKDTFFLNFETFRLSKRALKL